MNNSVVKNKKRKSYLSLIPKVFVRLFVCRQKKKKKGLKRFVSFRSIQLKTQNIAEDDTDIISTAVHDQEILQSDIIRSR